MFSRSFIARAANSAFFAKLVKGAETKTAATIASKLKAAGLKTSGKATTKTLSKSLAKVQGNKKALKLKGGRKLNRKGRVVGWSRKPTKFALFVKAMHKSPEFSGIADFKTRVKAVCAKWQNLTPAEAKKWGKK